MVGGSYGGWGPTTGPEQALPGPQREFWQEDSLGMCWTLWSWPVRLERWNSESTITIRPIQHPLAYPIFTHHLLHP